MYSFHLAFGKLFTINGYGTVSQFRNRQLIELFCKPNFNIFNELNDSSKLALSNF